jgi:hypothetical protein
MGATAEMLPRRYQGLRSSVLRKPLKLRAHACRILLDPDGSVRGFDSFSERRALFGLERVWIYKVQAGIVVQSQRPDWSIRVDPRSARMVGRVFESSEVAHSLAFFEGPSLGYMRKVKVTNDGASALRLRLIDLFDPTAAHSGDPPGRWGSLGLNAFNRDSHIAMDEVSDPPSARVIGILPPPSKFYMTTDWSRAQDLVAAGELPAPTAGMSGQVLILSLHDFELAPSESKEVTYASLYNPARLEDALSDFGRIQSGGVSRGAAPIFACSSSALTEAASWAVAAVQSAQFDPDILDRFESITALSVVDPALARSVFERAKGEVMREGSMPHSLDPSKPGILESAVFLQGLSRHLCMAQDKKLTRSLYPLVKKLARYLMDASEGYSVQTEPSLPQGWRRLIGRGYPTGEIPEVTLAVAGALAWASQVASRASRSDDAGKFRERSVMVVERAKSRFLDERGALCLCLDSSGRKRTDETIDMAVAAFRHPFQQSAERAAVHRLLEKDFETPYGPRCVPTSNRVYFNRSYGSGQLGGFWTRAALAHALLCYRLGLAGTGSLALQKVAKLVVEDSTRLGGSPGEFPFWLDVEGGEVHGDDTDRVAASRLVEGLALDESGLAQTSDRVVLTPPASSSLGWLLAGDIWMGERVSLFVGRASGKAHVFLAAARVECGEASRFSEAETLDVPTRGVHGVSFHGPGQVICLGNSANSHVRTAVTFSPRSTELSKRLSTPLEAYEPASESWEKVTSMRVSPRMTFEASLGPGEWRAYRVSNL